MLPACNGVMTVNRDYMGETPCGMKFTTLAGVMGGGQSSPGFVGHSKFNITQRKFLVGDGGLLRMVWMPKILKEEIKERIEKRGEELCNRQDQNGEDRRKESHCEKDNCKEDHREKSGGKKARGQKGPREKACSGQEAGRQGRAEEDGGKG